MPTAVLSDIHANLHALEAVVADARQRGADRFVCLGNVVGNGPNPIETLRWVKENCDWCMAGLFEDGFLGREDMHYWGTQLRASSIVWAQQEFQKNPDTADLVAWLKQCPRSVLTPPFWFIHGMPDGEWHLVSGFAMHYVTPARARKLFSAFPPGVTTCFGGATERGGVVWSDGRAAPEPILISPIPLDSPMVVSLDGVGKTLSPDARASYVMLDANQITFHRVYYDAKAFTAAVGQTSLHPSIAKQRFMSSRMPEKPSPS